MPRMKYSIRAPALKKLWFDLKEVGTLISLREVTESKPKQRKVNESLSRASLLLLCSCMEGFFERLVEDILQFHEFNETSVAALPRHLRVIQVCNRGTISDSATIENKWKFIRQVSISQLSDDSQNCTSGVFLAELHTKGFASPGSNDVNKLFQSIGIEDVWGLVEKRTGSVTLKRSLNSLVFRRNNIAHGNLADKLTLSDFKVTVRDMCSLARLFNDVTVQYLMDEFNTTHLWG